MREQQVVQAFLYRRVPRGNGLGPLDEAGGTDGTDLFQGRLFRREVIVETGLPHPEQVGNVLGRSPVIAAFGKYSCGRVDDLGPAFAQGTRCLGFVVVIQFPKVLPNIR